MKTDRYGRTVEDFQALLTHYTKDLIEFDLEVQEGRQPKSPLIRSSIVDNINYCRRMLRELA